MHDLFKDYGLRSKGGISITPREAYNLIKEGVFLIDLRDTDFSDYKAFDVARVVIIPMSVFEDYVGTLDSEAYFILADSSGIKSPLFVEKMRTKGFSHVASLSGGFVEWERDGLPVRVDVSERLSGACACQLRPRERKKE